MVYVIAVLVFILVISLLVLIHEFGHFIAAKKSGVKVEEFAIGMGPKIFSIKKGETAYSIRLLPLGGYVSMLGQDDFDHKKNDDPTAEVLDKRSYAVKSPWTRSLIVAMGVIMNFAFAILVYALMGLFSNFTYVFPQVANFPDNHYTFGDQRNANIATLINKSYGDSNIPQKIVITKVNGNSYASRDDLEKLINESVNKGTYLETTSILGGEFKKLEIKPTENFRKSVAVTSILKDSAADKAGIKGNLLIEKIGDMDIFNGDDFRKAINDNQDKEVTIKGYDLEKKENKEFKLSPKLDSNDNRYKIGVGLQDVSLIKTEKDGIIFLDGTKANVREYHGIEKVFAGFTETYNLSQYSISLLGQSIGQSFKEKSIEPVAQAASGPVGVFVTIKTLLDTLGVFGIIQLMAIISLSLAVFNLLPVPGLDGWHLYNNLFEGITGKRLPSKIFNIITIIGFGLLLVLMVLITVKDVFTFIIK